MSFSVYEFCDFGDRSISVLECMDFIVYEFGGFVVLGTGVYGFSICGFGSIWILGIMDLGLKMF